MTPYLQTPFPQQLLHSGHVQAGLCSHPSVMIAKMNWFLKGGNGNQLEKDHRYPTDLRRIRTVIVIRNAAATAKGRRL